MQPPPITPFEFSRLFFKAPGGAGVLGRALGVGGRGVGGGRLRHELGLFVQGQDENREKGRK